MKFGIHFTPFIPPTRSNRQAFDWIVDQALIAEELGLSEFWVGQHHSVAWEPVPAPEMIMSTVIRETERITVGTGGYQAPYYHPTMLASQAAWLSHISEGRFILGLATGVNPGDSQMHGFADMSRHLDMTIESIDIIQRFLAGGDFTYRGEFWNAAYPKAEFDRFGDGGHLLRSLEPFGGDLPIALTGGGPRSSSITVAGSRGLIPLSFAATPDAIAQQWDTYLDGARSAGRSVDISTDIRRVAVDVFVADSDAEARRLVRDGVIGQTWQAHLNDRSKNIVMLRRDEGGTTVDMDAVLDSGRIIAGSPETVAETLNEWLDATGGWGTTLIHGYDFMDDVAPWRTNLELLTTEVAPRLVRQLA